MNNKTEIETNLIYDLAISDEKKERLTMHKVVNYFIDGDSFLPENFQNFEVWTNEELRIELRKLNWDDLYTRLSLQEALNFDSAPTFWDDLINIECQPTNK